jgi:hypothetical protein
MDAIGSFSLFNCGMSLKTTQVRELEGEVTFLKYVTFLSYFKIVFSGMCYDVFALKFRLTWMVYIRDGAKFGGNSISQGAAFFKGSKIGSIQ